MRDVIRATLEARRAIQDPQALAEEIERRLELEPAEAQSAAAYRLAATAGSHLPPADITQVHREAQEALVAEVAKRGVGDKIRARQLAAAIMRDERVVDALITLSAKGGAAGKPGEDFQPDAGSAVQLASEDVSFATDAFDQPLAEGDTIAVEVRAVIAAQALPGVPAEQVKAQLAARLSAFFEKVAVGTAVDTAMLLTALRDDSKYALDPLKLQVTLTSADQFAQILQGGPPCRI